MPLTPLKKYLPEGSFDYVNQLLEKEYLHIKITPERKTRLGSFRPGMHGKHSIINISGTLNPYSFLITFIHEVAHLRVWKKYKNRTQPHGVEWKLVFVELMQPVLNQNVFPGDILIPLSYYLRNPGASSSRYPELTRALRQYDEVEEGILFLKDLPEDGKFVYDGDRVFKKIYRLRKRYMCLELKTKRKYLFSPVAEVKAFGS